VTPLVLLHGFSGAPEMWDPLQRLLPGARVLRPTIAGHGATPTPARGFEEEVDRLAAEIAAGGFLGAHLVGYSLGARLVLGLLVRHPALASRATLVGVNPGLPQSEERLARATADEAWVGLLATQGVARFAEAWGAQPMFESQRHVAPERQREDRDRRQSHDPMALAIAMRLLGLAAMPDYAPALPSVGVPVTLVAGELDVKFTALAVKSAAALPKARVVIVASAGHNVVLEQPAAIAALLEEEWP
jgi:2-succinyl-6-hydroxy-2,4-cyclohexadiene-1-carboxylate synthase